jgi:hypothetical protein
VGKLGNVLEIPAARRYNHERVRWFSYSSTEEASAMNGALMGMVVWRSVLVLALGCCITESRGGDFQSRQELESIVAESGGSTLRVSGFRTQPGAVTVIGVVESRRELTEVRRALAQSADVSIVDMNDVVVANESRGDEAQALRSLVRQLQDGRGFEQAIESARTLTASSDPETRTTGLVCWSLCRLYSDRTPEAAEALLAVAREVRPELTTDAAVQQFMAESAIGAAAGFPAETWNSEVVNPYFLTSRRLPSLLPRGVVQQRPEQNAARPSLQFVALLQDDAALPPGDLPVDLIGEGPIDPNVDPALVPVPDQRPAATLTAPIVEYSPGVISYPSYWNSYAPGYYYWAPVYSYGWADCYMPGYSWGSCAPISYGCYGPAGNYYWGYATAYGGGGCGYNGPFGYGWGNCGYGCGYSPCLGSCYGGWGTGWCGYSGSYCGIGWGRGGHRGCGRRWLW